MPFPRKPIPAGIADLPDLHVRKLSITELFEVQTLLGQWDGEKGFSPAVTFRLLALGLSDSSGNRIIQDGNEQEADGIGSDMGAVLNKILEHNGLGAQAKNESTGQSGV